MKLALEYDGKRLLSLDGFLKVLGISETEFEEILLNNKVFEWGFDHDKLQTGRKLPDMDLWDDIV